MLAYRPFSGLTLSHTVSIFTTERLFVAVLVRAPHSRSSPDMRLGGINSKCLVFFDIGCTVYQHIPNNTLALKGKRLLFMGFNHLAAKWRVFCPETSRRSTRISSRTCALEMRHRIDSLRHHDRRRLIIKRGDEQMIMHDIGPMDLETKPRGDWRRCR